MRTGATPRRSVCRRGRGTVLIVTIWVVLVLAGLALVFARSMRVAAIVSANHIASLQAEFGWTRARTSSVFSLYLVFSGVFSIVAGRVLDQYGPRVVVLILGVVTGVSLFLMSGIQASWELYLYYSVLLSLGTGPIYIVAMSTASRWFEKKRGTAVGIVGAGAGLGSVLLSPFSAWLIADYSWRQAYLVLGFVAVAVMVPAGLLMKQPSAEPVRSLPGNPTGHPRSDAPRFSPMNAMGSGTFRIPLHHLGDL